MEDYTPISTIDLLVKLDKMLIEFLSKLTDNQWNVQTVASKWKVKDVAAHLLDGNLRGLSTSRDGYFGEPAENINSYQDLVNYLNELNMSWTTASKRLSPKVLISLLESTGKEYTQHLASLDLNDDAIFSVAWAGQNTSKNWFHIAREYTEKFLHQQQIRDAVGDKGLLIKELYFPFVDTLMHAFPFTFKNVQAPIGAVVTLIITTEIGGQWSIIKNDNYWEFIKNPEESKATVEIDPDIAWKLFSKSVRPNHVLDKVNIYGDEQLCLEVLNIVAFMA